MRKKTCRLPKYDKARYDNYEMPSDDMDVDIQNWSSKLTSTRADTTCVYCGSRAGIMRLRRKDFLMGSRSMYMTAWIVLRKLWICRTGNLTPTICWTSGRDGQRKADLSNSK